MENFDFEELYYRPVHIRTGYATSDEINTVNGYFEKKGLCIEFSSLAKVGKWLFLGDEVKVLKIPKDAELVENRPMGQGGCYEYSANKVIVQETISVLELLKRANDKLIDDVYVKNVTFPGGFKLKCTDDVSLSECIFQGDLLKDHDFKIIKLGGCDIKGKLLLPESHELKEISLSDCNIKGELLLPERLEVLRIDNSGLTNFDFDIRFPKIVTKTLDLSFLEIKRGLDLSGYTCDYIRFEFCDFTSALTLPKKQKKYIWSGENGKKIEIDDEECSINFWDCFGSENIIIPENFADIRSLYFNNSPIHPKLAESLRQAESNCQLNIYFNNITLEGNFFQNLKPKRISISECKIKGKLLLPELSDSLSLSDNKHDEGIQSPKEVTAHFELRNYQIEQELDMSEYTCYEIYFYKCTFLNPVILPKKQNDSPEYKYSSWRLVHFEDCTGLENIIIPKRFKGGRVMKFFDTDIKPELVQELQQKYGCKVVL